MWSYIVLNRDVIEFCVFEFKDNACEAVPILVENYVTAEFDNYTLSSIAHSFLNKYEYEETTHYVEIAPLCLKFLQEMMCIG